MVSDDATGLRCRHLTGHLLLDAIAAVLELVRVIIGPPIGSKTFGCLSKSRPFNKVVHSNTVGYIVQCESTLSLSFSMGN